MFLIERLIGVGTYAIVLFLMCFFISKTKEQKTIKTILFLYIIILSIMAYKFVPHTTADLYRIYGFVKGYEKYSFDQFWQLQMGSFKSAQWLYWIVSKTGVPQLLPTVTTIVCYSCIFYVIYKTAEKNQISAKNVAIILFYFMSIGTYIFVISGIRCMIGISLLAFCFFRENAEGKFKILHIFLYLIAASIHLFAATLIFARFIIPLFDSKTNSIRKIVYFICLMIGVVLVSLNFGEFLDAIIDKADSYIGNEHAYTYVWDYITAGIVCFVHLWTIVGYKRIKNEGTLKLNGLRAYLMLCMAIALCLCFEFSIFHRTITYILPIISLPALMTMLQSKDNVKSNDGNSVVRSSVLTIQNMMFILLSAMILLLSCSRGSLCSLKFFEL